MDKFSDTLGVPICLFFTLDGRLTRKNLQFIDLLLQVKISNGYRHSGFKEGKISTSVSNFIGFGHRGELLGMLDDI